MSYIKHHWETTSDNEPKSYYLDIGKWRILVHSEKDTGEWTYEAWRTDRCLPYIFATRTYRTETAAKTAALYYLHKHIDQTRIQP